MSDKLAATMGGLTMESTRMSAELFADGLRGKYKSVIVMMGAGCSVSAGIPDFRTPGTGLYDNLQKYDLPQPEMIFELNYFRQNPKPFCTLAKELFPGTFSPTPSHHFLKLLADRGMLLRCFFSFFLE
jgi:NAD-dependent deacetylase sirtuin 2